MKVKVQSETISAAIMYNMKSERETWYAQNVLGQKFNHHRYTPLHKISMGFLLRHFHCSNIVFDVLSAPNHGLAIPTLQYLKWETAIANAVIDNLIISFSTNPQEDVLPMFHIDNID